MVPAGSKLKLYPEVESADEKSESNVKYIWKLDVSSMVGPVAHLS